MTDGETQETFDHRLYLMVMAKIRSHCDLVARQIATGERYSTDVYLHIGARRSASDEARRKIRTDTERMIAARIKGRVQVVTYGQPPDTASDIAVIVTGYSRGSQTTTGRLPPEYDAIVGEQDRDSTARLTMSYGTEAILQCGLHPANAWRKLGRDLPAPREGEMTPVRISSRVAVVPRGPLLYLRFWNENLDLLRTGERRDYLVIVDRVPLRSGDVVRCRRAGDIEFRRDDGVSNVVSYSFRLES